MQSQVRCPDCYGWILADPAGVPASGSIGTMTVDCDTGAKRIPLRIGMTWILDADIA